MAGRHWRTFIYLVTWALLETCLAVDDLHCNNPIGLSTNFPADKIVVSSSSAGHEKEFIRYGCCSGQHGKAWCPAVGDPDPFVEIHLPSPVPIGSLHLQPPTVLGPPFPANNPYPEKFMVSFDLLFKLKGLNSLLTVAENVPAIANETVKLVDIGLRPALFTDLIRIEPKTSRGSPCFRLELCEYDISALCPPNFCKNGGVCSGQFACDCSSTGYFGDQCQLTQQNIPVTTFKFVTTIQQTVVTTSTNLTLHGQVSLDTSDLLNPALVIPAGSYVDLKSPGLDVCLTDLDQCRSGFTITVTISFSQTNSGQQMVLTSGGLENNIPGIALFFQKGEITAFVGTSTQAWVVTKNFPLVANRWYELTVSWSPNQGLVVLNKDQIIGSSFLAGRRVSTGTSSKQLTLGSPLKTTLAVLKVKAVLTVSLFVQEANRAGLTRLNSGATTTPAVAATTTATVVKTTAAPSTTSSTVASTTAKWVPVCNKALGMRDSSIRPGQLSASSSIAGHGTEMARAGCCQGMEDGAWCADPSDPDPWIQVVLSSPMALSAVSFQVPERVNKSVIPTNFIKTVRLEYRDLSTTNASMTTFGNLPVTMNATVAYMANLKPYVVTDLVRMHVVDATGNACIRFELQGCDPDDLCSPNYCQNNGTCIGENRCKCEDDYYGNRCELTKKQIVSKPVRFLTMKNGTITTTDNSTTLTAQGNVTLISSGNHSNVIQLTSGGSVTLPADPCIQTPSQCVSGFTVIVEISLVNVNDDQVYIATSTGGNKGSPGVSLIYDPVKHELIFQVATGTHTWTVNATFTWQQSSWHNVTITFSPSAGITLLVDGLLLGGKTGVKTAPRSPTSSATQTTPLPSSNIKTTPSGGASSNTPMSNSKSSVSTPGAAASTMAYQTTPPASLVAGKALCLGCVPGSVVTSGKNSTTTILIWSVLTVHVHLTDLQRAGVTTVKKPSKNPVTCHSTKLEFNFLNMTDTKTKVVTSLGSYKSYGNVTVEREKRNVLLVLDSQGEYVEVSNTGHPCVDDITACASNLTYRLVFRFLDFHVEPNFLLSSGGDLLNSTGLSLYYFHGKFNFWVKDGVWVWRAIYDVTLDLDRWYTVDASWSHVTGIRLYLDGVLLQKRLNSTHQADHVTEKHPLHIARSPSPDKNKTSLMEVLMFRVWTKTIEELQTLGCDDDTKIKNPVDRCKANMTEVKFEEVLRGHDLVTSLGTMVIHGNVSVEKTLFQQGQVVLLLSHDGDYVDMGVTGVACLDDVTSCSGSFNFRITFLLREISQTPNYIITSGGELLNSTGVSLYYHNGQLRFWVKRGRQTDRKIFNYNLYDNTWYTLDASWDSTDGSISVFIDGSEIAGQQLFSTPTPPTTLVYPIHLGKSPGKNATTKMNILLFRFWERTHTDLVKQGCSKTLTVRNPPNPPATTTTTQASTTSQTSPPRTTPATVQTKVVFKEIKGTTLVTSYINMTIHGSVSLQYVPAGQILVIEKPDAYVDIGKTGIPCLDDVSSCNTGFNFRLIFTLTSFTNRSQVLISNGADKDAKAGVTVLYVNSTLVVYVRRPSDTLVGTFPCTLNPGYWYTVDVTWTAQGSLDVHLNNLLLPGTLTVSKVTIQLNAQYSLLLGKSPGDAISTNMRVFEIDLWTQIYTRIKRQQLQLPKLDNYNLTTPQPKTTPEMTTVRPTSPEIISSTTEGDTMVTTTRSTIFTTTETTLAQKAELSTTPTSTVQHTTKGLVKDFVWTLVNVTQRVLVSHELELVIVGGPTVDKNGITLDSRDKYIRIPNINDTCLTDPSLCVDGVTIEIVVKLTTLEENSIVFTSGGEVPDQPGITLLYRFGQIHVVVSTTLQSWYVTLSKRLIWTNDFCKVQVSWSKLTSLQVFINEVLVGVSTTPVDHGHPTISVTDSLTIGGGRTTCVVNKVHIWLVSIDILINLDIIKGPEPTTATTTAGKTTTTLLQDVSTMSSVGNTCPTGCYSPQMCFDVSTQQTTTAGPKSTMKYITTAGDKATTTKPVTQRLISTLRTTEPTTKKNPTTAKKQTPPTSATKTTTTTTTTATPTTTTMTPSTTKTTPRTTTTTPRTTTTTPTTSTTTATTSTTIPPCPEAPKSVVLTPGVDVNGQGLLTCSLAQAPSPGLEVRFTFSVQGQRRTWTQTIENPDKSASVSIADMGLELMNKKISCKAQARHLLRGANWCWDKSSNVLVPSIKCPPMRPNGHVTVVEGREDHLLQLQTTVPPPFLCKLGDAGKCRVEVITEIKTERRELTCSRQVLIPQLVLGVSVVGDNPNKACGVSIDKSNWQTGVVIPVKATVDGIVDRDRTHKLNVTVRIVGQVTMNIDGIQCGEIRFKAVDRDRKATCGSVNDPHITTFDKVRYNNFIKGEFTLYEHKTLPYEVRALYQPCRSSRPNGPTCNCGAAVMSGDDVIVFNTCNARPNQGRGGSRTSAIVVQMFKNGQLTPGTRIRRLGCGQKYEVILPTGTKVVISASRRPFMNIHIHGSAPDFNNVQGLCGNFNGAGNDDLEGERGRTPDRFSRKWKRSDTIFKGVPRKATPAPVQYCSCHTGKTPVCRPGLDIYKCQRSASSNNDVTAVLARQAKTPVLNRGNNRRRRAAGDQGTLSTLAPDNGNVTSFTLEAATRYCENYLQTKATVKACQGYLDSEAVAESVLSCAEDLQDLGDTEWAVSHVEDLTETCVESAQREESAWNSTAEERDGEPELPEVISSGLCQEDCGQREGRGACVAGICECKDGFTGVTCQLSKATRPEVLPATEACDLITSSCTDVTVEGDNFVPSTTLSCKFKYAKFQVGSNLTLTREEATVPAEFVSISQVVCPLPPEAIARGRSAYVSVSNDGAVESEQIFLHVVHKSTCQDCQLMDNGLDAYCVYKSDSCVIDGECYAALEKYQDDTCYRCDPEVSPTAWTKTSEPRCIIQSSPSAPSAGSEDQVKQVEGENSNDQDDDTLVIVLGVMCGVLALVALVAFVIIFRRLSAQKKDTLLPAQDLKFDIHRKGVTPPESSASDILTGSASAARFNSGFK